MGRYIGVEYAHFFETMGLKVTIVFPAELGIAFGNNVYSRSDFNHCQSLEVVALFLNLW
jgi:hypothetical protein